MSRPGDAGEVQLRCLRRRAGDGMPDDAVLSAADDPSTRADHSVLCCPGRGAACVVGMGESRRDFELPADADGSGRIAGDQANPAWARRISYEPDSGPLGTRGCALLCVLSIAGTIAPAERSVRAVPASHDVRPD